MPYAIITGGTRGMGKAIAEKLLAEDFSIAICARDRRQLDQVQSEWNEKYPTASILTCEADMSSKDDVAAFATLVLANFPEIDILVNNAGGFLMGSMTQEPDGQLEKMLGINLYGPYNLTKAIAPVMKQQKRGHIFNTCSVASLAPHPASGSYSVSKYALLGFTYNLREELKEHGIRVTALCPGSTFTSSWAGSNIDPQRLLEEKDIVTMLWSAYSLSPQACVETIVMRPLEGNI